MKVPVTNESFSSAGAGNDTPKTRKSRLRYELCYIKCLKIQAPDETSNLHYSLFVCYLTYCVVGVQGWPTVDTWRQCAHISQGSCIMPSLLWTTQRMPVGVWLQRSGLKSVSMAWWDGMSVLKQGFTITTVFFTYVSCRGSNWSFDTWVKIASVFRSKRCISRWFSAALFLRFSVVNNWILFFLVFL